MRRLSETVGGLMEWVIPRPNRHEYGVSTPTMFNGYGEHKTVEVEKVLSV